MWFIRFRIAAEFGQFRNPYTTVYTQTYPFPPKPTIIGMIGAMFGWSEEEVLNSINFFKIGIPEWDNHGKFIDYAYILAYKETQTELRPERFEILIKPQFEVIVGCDDENWIKEIEKRIIQRDFVFPLYMGKNEFVVNEINLLKERWKENITHIKKAKGVITYKENKILNFKGEKGNIKPPQILMAIPLLLSKDPQSNTRRLEATYSALLTKDFLIFENSLEGLESCFTTLI